MRLEWSILAQADREAISDYIEAEQPTGRLHRR
jgi:plasmid stabilization system protein ParE